MSRIGRKPVELPASVTFENNNGVVTVKGPLGTLTREFPNSDIKFAVENNQILVTRDNDKDTTRALHGLYRQLLDNMVVGVTKGYERSLNINGVGYKTSMNGQNVILNIGLSHPVEVVAIPGITLSCDKTVVTVKGIDKELVGQFAAKIRDIKPVEPYHAYGITYTDEVVVRKERKTGKK